MSTEGYSTPARPISLPTEGFFSELRRRDPVLFWSGAVHLVAGIVCLVLMALDSTTILGINRWIKPTKFFLSVWMMSWTVGWLMHYLKQGRAVTSIRWTIAVSMIFENGIIALQAVRGVPSHFNVGNPLDGMLFGIMGILIMIFSVAILVVIILYFRQREFGIASHYLWSIRLGLVLFLIFSLEGGLMAGRLSHSVGGADGGAGWPFTNWSTSHGDLRIAHFLGLHALQLLPLAGYYLLKSVKQVVLFAVIYFCAVTFVLIQALMGLPLI
jgi:hypothetical protein